MAEIDEFFVAAERAARVWALRCSGSWRRPGGRSGCVRLQLQLGNGNHAARAFYERRGFAGRDGYSLLDKPLR